MARVDGTSPERRIARAVAAGGGVATRAALRGTGVSDDVIDRRIANGFLVPVRRGVLSIGRPLKSAGEQRAAGLAAAGPDAVLSHDSAAAIWGWPTDGGRVVHLTCPRRRRRSEGFVFHESPLHPRSSTTRNGQRCTTVARTLVDVAGMHGPLVAERAWSSAASMRQLRPRDLAFEVESGNGRAGVATVRRLLRRHTALAERRTRSELEREALRLIAARRIVPPAVNRLVLVGARTFEADLLWGDRRLIAELDGRSVHEHREAFESDRERDAVLGLAGWRVTRLTWWDLTGRPAATARRIRGFLAQEPLRAVPGRRTGRVGGPFMPRGARPR